jgi:peroxisomal 2,4-dienoyl-CoA reductase
MQVFQKDFLSGRVALVTGGGTGIGRHIAAAMGAHGAGVVIFGRRQAVLDEACAAFTAAGIDCLAIAGDVRDPAAVGAAMAATLSRFGRLDIVVNNAAGNFPARIEELSANAFRTIIDINLQGTFNVTRAAFDAWLKEHGGAVINITAPFEGFGVAWQAHAAAAKSGVASFTRSAAVEWRALGIRVNAIAPGGIQRTEGADRLGGKLTEGNRAATYGSGEDVAHAALFLASDAAAFITGVNLHVDGGGAIDMLKLPVYDQP